MNNLQPLKWTQKNLNPLAELELTAYSALHEYEITEPKQGRFEIKKTRLGEPDKKSEYMTGFARVKDAQDSAIDTFSKVAWFNANIGKFDYQHDDVLAWMPIPEFKQGE